MPRKPNTFRIDGPFAFIAIGIAKDGSLIETVVDFPDLDLVMSLGYRWACKRPTKGTTPYAQAVTVNGSRLKAVSLHRHIMKAPVGIEVDHINRNGLDNRRCNLRLVSRNENQQNQEGPRANSSTGIRGVYWRKSKERYIAKIMVNGEIFWLGSYKTAEEASTAYELARLQRHPNCPASTSRSHENAS